MKQLHFVLQSKGGVGKTLLTTLFALKHKDEQTTAFVDLDSSTTSLTRQVNFIDERCDTVSLLNEKEVLVRDNLVSYIESLVDSPFETIFFDFGAPESEQFPALIERDLPFEEFLEMLDMNTIQYHIVIAGGSAYIPCVHYLQKLHQLVGDKSSINVWASITTFNQQPNLMNELQVNCNTLGFNFHKFGDFDPQSHLGGQLLNSIRAGLPIEQYSPGARLRMMKELKENITI